jgi:hypothetical protein
MLRRFSHQAAESYLTYLRTHVDDALKAKRPETMSRAFLMDEKNVQPARDFTRFVRRAMRRDAVFLCTMPFWAARMTIGSALASAVLAAAPSPDVSASSTFRRKVRIWLRRERFTAVRRAIFRTAFFAEAVFAISKPRSMRRLRSRKQEDAPFQGR